jgi:hypothetical protein
MIGKRERRRGAHFGHVAGNAISAFLLSNVDTLVGMAIEAFLVVDLWSSALRVAVGRMASCTLNLALSKTGAFHDA